MTDTLNTLPESQIPVHHDDDDADDDDGNDDKIQFKKFPRVKLLISADYEFFLKALLENVESAGCAGVSTGGNNTPWHIAFEKTYSGVGANFAKPSGKNRFHKFKVKVVSLWETMEEQVNHGFKSATHPLYSLAAKQLETYRTVSMPVRPGKRGRPKKSEREAWLRQSKLAAATAASAGDDQVEVLDSPIGLTSPKACENIHARLTKPAPTFANSHTEGRLTTSITEQWTKSLSRLEATVASMLSRQQTPVLPSPLHELHQIKARTIDSEEMELIKPYYDKALGKHLSLVSEQASNSAHPQMLPNILQGLDVLRSGETDAATASSINYAYKSVLTKYLELSNPTMSLQADRQKRKSNASNAASGVDSSPKRMSTDTVARSEAL